jgi:hypothetical protein
MFVCPWKLTLEKFDEKFIDRDEYNAMREQEIITNAKAILEEAYGAEAVEQTVLA